VGEKKVHGGGGGAQQRDAPRRGSGSCRTRRAAAWERHETRAGGGSAAATRCGGGGGAAAPARDAWRRGNSAAPQTRPPQRAELEISAFAARPSSLLPLLAGKSMSHAHVARLASRSNSCSKRR
jgi:hypothetical protein